MSVDESTSLQLIFDEPILEQQRFAPGYSGYANDVWGVRTATEDVIVRIGRGQEDDGPFWTGCRMMFGIAPGRPDELAVINVALAPLSLLPIPRVLRTGDLQGRPYAVVHLVELADAGQQQKSGQEEPHAQRIGAPHGSSVRLGLL